MRFRGRLSTVLLGIVVLLLAGLTGFVLYRIASLEDELVLRIPENRLWAAVQAETELARLLDALSRHGAADPTIDQDRLLQRFDVLWSRVGLFQAGDLASGIVAVPGAQAVLADLQAALEEADPLIAALGSGDAVGATALRTSLEPFVHSLREISVATLHGDVHGMTVLRDAHSDLRRQLWLLGPALLGCGGLLGLMLVRSERAAGRLARENQAARAETDALHGQLVEAIESVEEGFALYDRDLRLVACNRQYRELYASPQAALTPGARLVDILREVAKGRVALAGETDTDGWIEQRLERIRAGGGTFEQQLDDGRWLMANDRTTADGGVVLLRTDITAVKERELELQRIRQELIERAAQTAILAKEADEALRILQHAITSIGEGFALFDAEDRLVLCNDVYRDLYGVLGPRLQRGMPFEAMLREALQLGVFGLTDDVEATVATRIAERRSAPTSVRERQDADGRWFRLSTRTTGDGGVVTIATNITELKQRETRLRLSEESLRAEKERAESASRAKSEFLAMMGHEIRTPINGVLGALGLLAERPLPEPEQRLLDIARSSGEHLLSVLNAVLDWSKIEAGRMELESAAFHVGEAIASVADLYRIQAKAKGLTLDVAIDPATPAWCRGDVGRIRQMLMNYVANAVKFTERGSIRIEAALSLQHTGWLRVEVADTGPGVPSAQRGELFRDFSQLDRTIARRYGGTGLGLAITRRLALLMGGEVGVEDRIGGGSRFWFEVPLEAAPAASQAPVAQLPVVQKLSFAGRRPRLLLAEDNPTNQLISRAMLEQLGCTVDLVGDGAEAVEAARSRAYDIVVLDVSMPVLDGLGAARIIREEGFTGPLVALSATAPSNLADAASFGLWLVKPVGKPALAEALAALLPAARETEVPIADVAPVLDEAVVDRLVTEIGPAETATILEAALADIDRLTAQLSTSLAAGAPACDLRMPAHALKGVARSVGAEALATLAQRLEATTEHGGQAGRALAGRLAGTLQATRKVLLERQRSGLRASW